MMDITFGKVENIEDPAKAGRVECSLAEVGGQTYPEWFNPIFLGSWCMMPDVGDIVLVVIPGRDDITEFPEEVYYLGVRLNQETPVHDILLDGEYGKRRGFQTKGGHFIVVDDTKGAEEITISYKGTMLVSLTPSGIFLGTKDATEPMVLGELWKTLMSDILGELLTHTHVAPAGGGPTLPPSVPEITALTALQGEINAGNHISNFIFGQKTKP